MMRKGGDQFSENIMLQEDRQEPAHSSRREDESAAACGRQRIDRWLWHARLVRTRGAAAALAGAGYVRVNGVRVAAPGRMVRAGDVITVALDRRVCVLKVKGFVERRGPAEGAATLYDVIE